jgi:predicted ATPase
LHLNNCKRLNVIVGENGSGKTALLESIFLPLSGSTEVVARLRQQRGIDPHFSGQLRRVEDAIWGDFFRNSNTRQPIVLRLEGDGAEKRSLTIARGRSDIKLSLDDEAEIAAPVVFTWKDAAGREYVAEPTISASGFTFPGTNEDLPDFFHFPANQTIPSRESAEWFSDLSKKNRHHQFVEVFSKEYDWIENINVEVSAGNPVLYATLKGSEAKRPLPNISGGINRVVAFMLAIASRPRSVLTIDEIENGIYYKHQVSLWRSLLSFVREYDSQVFATTHSAEWLEALPEAAQGQVDDIALWRIERGEQQPTIRQFSGKQAIAGIRAGEVR